MATLQTILVHLLVSLTLFSSVHLALTTTINTTMVATTTKPRRFVAKLLHRDSVLHYPNDTIKNRSERALNNSIARLIYLSQKASQAHYAEAPLLVDQSSALLFFVSFSIGQPPIPQLAPMDTGSDLIWVTCKSGEQYGTNYFDPSKSSTYVRIGCGYTVCDLCNEFNECTYIAQYINGPDSNGILAREQFAFETSDEGTTTVNDVVFGCSHQSKVIRGLKQSRGMFGLGTRRKMVSLFYKFGSRFSHCIGNMSDPKYSSNKLILGEGVLLQGDSTPLTIDNGIYYVIVEGISIGEKMLDINPKIFKDANGISQVVIDSGAPLTWLVTGAYRTLREEIEGLLEGLLTRQPSTTSELCYYGKINKDLREFPVMTIHFADAAELALDSWSLFFHKHDSVFCLAIRPNKIYDSLKDTSVIGILAQQHYNVAYDLMRYRLYFQQIDCELLED